MSSFVKTSGKLKEWSGMFVNPDKFKALVIDKKRTNYTYEKLISNEDIRIVPSVKLLGITIDERISSICKLLQINKTLW